jgi:hypothetical protein
MKNPIVKIEKPTNAISCSKLALANEKAVCVSIVSSSAERGADHVHGELKSQDH